MYNTQFNPYAQNVNIVKGYFKKIPVLLLAILQFVGTGLSIAFAIVFSLWSTTFTQDLVSQYSSEISGFSASDLNGLMQTSLVSTIASMVPTAIVCVLITVGYLLLFLKSRSSNPDSNPRAGATILFVLALIEMICSIIIVAALAVIFIISAVAVAFGASSSDFNAGPILVIMGVSLLFIIFFVLFYSVNKMRYFKSVKNSCSSINLYADGAGAFGVMNIIFAVFTLLGLVSTALMIPLSSLTDEAVGKLAGVSLSDYIDGDSLVLMVIFSSAVMLISAVYMILEATVALGYKKYINNIKYNYQPANIPEAPYQPAVKPTYTAAPAAPVTYQPPVQQPAQTAVQPEANTPPKAEENVPAFSAPSYCPACGSPIEQGAAFCTNCGNKLK